MKIFIPVNQKGGVGKTQTSYGFTHYLADEGKRVLGVDGDEQANYSRLMAAYAVDGIGASHLFGATPLALPPVPPGGISVIKADPAGLRALERSPVDDRELLRNLRANLAALAPHFDYAVFDSPGSNSRVANALLACSGFALIPTKIDQDSIDVSLRVFRRIKGIQADWNPALVNLGFLPNEYDARQPVQRESLKKMLGAVGIAQFPAGYVHDRAAYREASIACVPVWRLREDGQMKSSTREAASELKVTFGMLFQRMEAGR